MMSSSDPPEVSLKSPLKLRRQRTPQTTSPVGPTTLPRRSAALVVAMTLLVTAAIASLLGGCASTTPGRPGAEYHQTGGGDHDHGCLLYTSDAADDLTRVDLGGRR